MANYRITIWEKDGDTDAISVKDVYETYRIEDIGAKVAAYTDATQTQTEADLEALECGESCEYDANDDMHLISVHRLY